MCVTNETTKKRREEETGARKIGNSQSCRVGYHPNAFLEALEESLNDYTEKIFRINITAVFHCPYIQHDDTHVRMQHSHNFHPHKRVRPLLSQGKISYESFISSNKAIMFLYETITNIGG